VKIIEISEIAIENYPYWIVKKGGIDKNGNQTIQEVDLPIFLGKIAHLGENLDAIIATSDLQGIVKHDDKEYLLGEKLPEFLSIYLELEFPKLDKNRIGILLCGDLYANLEKRGVGGNVQNIWREFNKYFKWVVGVAGNHDDFGNIHEFNAFRNEQNIYYLHKDIQKIDRLNFGGISGIIGRSDKPQRVEEKEYLMSLKKMLLKQPSSILLHQSPDVKAEDLEGNEAIRKVIESSPQNLIFCGHSHWNKQLVVLENGTQIVNLDGKVLVLINDTLTGQK
jgi:Icc-related predicted phosphoesterase